MASSDLRSTLNLRKLLSAWIGSVSKILYIGKAFREKLVLHRSKISNDFEFQSGA